MRLLIAEDEKSLSKALTVILEKNNYSVDAAFDGEEALYGLGQPESGPANLRGRKMYLCQMNRQIALPFFASTAGYGLLIDCGCPFVFCDNDEGSYLYLTAVEQLDYYVIPGGGEEAVKEDLLDSPRDILFYENRPETAGKEGRVVMESGDYAIYFPWDVHIPGQCEGDGPKDYRKIVLKVPMASCLGAEK